MMWEVLSSILKSNDERLPESLNRAIYALRDGRAEIAPKKLPTSYRCAQCGGVVGVIGCEITRSCGHVDAGIIADIKAVAYGVGGMES